MLDLEHDWVWDFWLADDGDRYHAFFLQASRALADPDLRHHNATVGHAVSDDLVHWAVRDDVLHPGGTGDFDDLAIWTGSIVRTGSSGWRMFYTGLSRRDGSAVQRIGSAVSEDLDHWQRVPALGLHEADPRHYRRRATSSWLEEAWRDPFVLCEEAGLWHAYVTARAGTGAGLGVVGHATSPDLDHWTAGPPLSAPTGRFEWLEVISLVCVEDRWVLIFSCLSDQMPGAGSGSGGVWSVRVAGPGTQVDVGAAVRLTTEDLYVGKVVRDRAGTWQLLAFRNRDEAGRFVGGVIDPIPVRWNRQWTGLELVGGPDQWRPC